MDVIFIGIMISLKSIINSSYVFYMLLGIKNVQETQNAKVGDMILEILNLQKREEVTVDALSSHDFTEVRTVFHILL